MKLNFRDAYYELKIPQELVDAAKNEGSFHLYLSGGGFRAWSYLLYMKVKYIATTIQSL